MHPWVSRLLAFGLLFATAARAQDKARCLQAAEAGQDLRDKGGLLAARAQFLECAAEHCPKVLREQCLHWRDDVEVRLPSIIVRLKDAAGQDVTGGSLVVDAHLPALEIRGNRVEVDPGAHLLHLQAPGHSPLDVNIVLRETEKNRWVDATVLSLAGPAVEPAASAPAAAVAVQQDPTPAAPFRWWSTGFGAGAVVGGAAFAGFGLSAQGDVNRLRTTCAPNCANSDVQAARNKELAANIALGTGLAAAAVAVYAFVLGH